MDRGNIDSNLNLGLSYLVTSNQHRVDGKTDQLDYEESISRGKCNVLVRNNEGYSQPKVVRFFKKFGPSRYSIIRFAV